MSASPLLAFDTSGVWCSAAVLDGPTLHVRRAAVGHAHSDRLLPMIRGVLADAGIALTDCRAIAFGAGPGSFTGLRIAAAVAQGLAFGAGCGVIPIGTLEAIAWDAVSGTADAGRVLVIHDARMGEVYWSLLDWTGSRLVPLIEPRLSKPAAVEAALDGRPIAWGCGNGWAVYPFLGDLVARVVAIEAADAAAIARLGARAYDGGGRLPADSAVPIYVRNDVADTTARRLEKKAASALAA